MHLLAFILLVIGGLNWGLYGLGLLTNGNWNVINRVFGGVTWLEAVIYILVGLAAVWKIFTHHKDCRLCCGDNKMSASSSGQ